MEEGLRTGPERGEGALHRPSSPSPEIVKAVLGVATSVGVLAFVTLVGGAIQYAQAAALGLPADQVVAAMPQSTLLVVGARFMIPVLLIIGVLLAAVGVVEHYAGENSRRARGFGTAVLGGVGVVFLVVDVVRADGSAIAYVAPVVMWAILLFIIFFIGIRDHPESPKFRTYAAVTATATAVFAAIFAVVLASAAPAVRAVGIDRKQGPPVTGLYAASNSDEVLVGQACQTRTASRRGSKLSGVLIRVPRDEISAVFVTTNGSVKDALDRQPALLEKAGGSAPAKLARCTDPLSDELERIGKAPQTRHQGVPGVLEGP
jgi:hypothetical protein